MTTQAENDRLCQVGPGTAMGDLMRRYWWPIAEQRDLATPDCGPIAVRLFGENLIAFRNSDGRVGLLDEHCPHRGVSLLIGRVEKNGIRCIYHGWKFGVDGKIQDMMNECAVAFRDRYKANAYSVREEAGVIWAYVGPKDKEPPFRHFSFMDVPPENRTVFRVNQNANYLQLVEQGSDSAHVGVLHSAAARTDWMEGDEVPGADPLNPAGLLGNDLAPKLEVEDTEFGFHYAAFRQASAHQQHVRVYPFLMPTIRFIPAADIMFTVFEVAIDDANTSTFINVHGDRPIDRAHVRRLLFGDGEKFWSEEDNNFKAPRESNYFQDRSIMGKHWSGFPGIAVEDAIVGVAAGPIADRTKEHLVPADAAVVRVRRQLLKAADIVEKGGDPIGVDYVECERLSAPDQMIGMDERWQDLVPLHRPRAKANAQETV